MSEKEAPRFARRKGPAPRDIKARFMEKVNKRGPWCRQLRSRCWVWTASTYKTGYGQFSVARSKPKAAHRVVWSLWKGPIGKLHVLHKCDNKRCVRLSHLFLGTAADNSHDMYSKGRQGKGNSKLTACEVASIRSARKAGSLLRELAARYNVTESTIGYITRGDTWA